MSDNELTEVDETKWPAKASRMYKKKVKCIENINEVTIESFVRRSDCLTLNTVQNVIRQLGYLPYNLVEVAAQSPSPISNEELNPLVLKLYPLNTNDLSGRYAKSVGQPLPFPTMMWMSCRVLYAQISVLEDAGWIQVFQKKLLNSPESPEWLQIMENAHRQYAAERWAQISPVDMELVERNNWWGLNHHTTSCTNLLVIFTGLPLSVT